MPDQDTPTAMDKNKVAYFFFKLGGLEPAKLYLSFAMVLPSLLSLTVRTFTVQLKAPKNQDITSNFCYTLS